MKYIKDREPQELGRTVSAQVECFRGRDFLREDYLQLSLNDMEMFEKLCHSFPV